MYALAGLPWHRMGRGGAGVSVPCQEIPDRCSQTREPFLSFPPRGGVPGEGEEDTRIFCSPPGLEPSLSTSQLPVGWLAGLAPGCGCALAALLFVCPGIKCSLVVRNLKPATRLQMWFWSSSQNSVC